MSRQKISKADFKWDMLKGKKIMGKRMASTPQLLFEFALRKNDLDPNVLNVDKIASLCLPKTPSATGTVSIRDSARSMKACEPSLACCSSLLSRVSDLEGRLRRNSSRFVINSWWFNGVGRLVRV